MSAVSVLGAGAFGTALAIALSRSGAEVTLWARDSAIAQRMQNSRVSGPRLPEIALPGSLVITAELEEAADTGVLLLAVPMQALAGFLTDSAPLLRTKTLVACCKGVDLTSGLGPIGVIRAACPDAQPALLTGPSFAADIAVGLPTALTLAAETEGPARQLQDHLASPSIRLYRTTDLIGAELGGALKNVVALAAGMAVGAGLGDSARAALVTRGFAEMVRFATARGARPETLNGLSGLGDLVLTCTSAKSRNFAAGEALGRGEALPEGVTIEGVATARAVAARARSDRVEMPVTETVADILDGRMTLGEAVNSLLSRPLKSE